jgi:hypothetical protein
VLAQHWLYGERVPSPYDGYLRSRLELPTKFNPNSGVAVLNKLAERIVFTDDVPSILYDMHDNKQLTFIGVLTSARLPYDCFWIEYTSTTGIDNFASEIEYAAYGALIQRIDTERVRMTIVTGLKDREYDKPICTLTHVLTFAHWPPGKLDDKTLGFAVDYAFNEKMLYKHKQSAVELSSIVLEIVFGIFLVTQPKCYVDEQIKWKPSHAAKRAKADKPPLLEYRKIRLHICRPHKRYEHRPAIGRGLSTAALRDVEDDASVQHRRYHKVMGHFRHYLRHDPPRSVWIEAHYRGDPKLGVTFTERDVTR